MSSNKLEAARKAQIIATIRELDARLADKLEMLDRQPLGKAGFWDAVIWLVANDPVICEKLAMIETVQGTTP